MFFYKGSQVKGNELIRRIKKLAKEKSILCEYRRERGKGSHGTLYYGDKRTIIRNPKDELKTGTFNAILKQLDIDESELK
jgi:mRNA interferase HicA